MTTCAHCGERKGKRTCPALRGAICPTCCGQHRLREIDCPAGCVHLGGLAVVRDPDRGEAAFTSADYNAMLARLEDYAGGMGALGRAALRRLYDGRTEPADWEAPVGMAYLYYGHRDPGGRRMIDHFIAARGRGLRPAEAAAALALQRAWASLFEITAVHAGVGMELRDLRTGDSVTVREVTATSQLGKRDILFTWIIEFPGRLELTGAACVVPRPDLDKVRAALDAELSRARREHPGVGDRELVGSVAWVVIAALRAAFPDLCMPELQTTDGEALVLSRAWYAVLDESAVRAALAAVPDLETDNEADDEGFTWLARGGNDVVGPGRLTLGRVHLAGGELVLETMSRERHERGRRMLEDALGEQIQHRADSFQDAEAALREEHEHEHEHARLGYIEHDEAPAEVRRELAGQYLRDHYQRWLDMPLPVLGGATPRDAARTPAGRAQVEELLAQIEHDEARMDGGDALDFATMRRELGLAGDGDDTGDDDDDEALRYDAAQRPDAARWLALDDLVKARAVEAHHRELGTHPALPNPRMHALMHVIAENQLAGGSPPEARAAIERLMGAGLSRHAAIHAVGSVVAEAIWQALRDQVSFDRKANARALERLRPEGWSF